MRGAALCGRCIRAAGRRFGSRRRRWWRRGRRYDVLWLWRRRGSYSRWRRSGTFDGLVGRGWRLQRALLRHRGALWAARRLQVAPLGVVARATGRLGAAWAAGEWLLGAAVLRAARWHGGAAALRALWRTLARALVLGTRRARLVLLRRCWWWEGWGGPGIFAFFGISSWRGRGTGGGRASIRGCCRWSGRSAVHGVSEKVVEFRVVAEVAAGGAGRREGITDGTGCGIFGSSARRNEGGTSPAK